MAGATPRPIRPEPGAEVGRPPTTRAATAPRSGYPDWLRLAIVRVAAYAVLANALLALHSRYFGAEWLPDWTIATVLVLLGTPSAVVVAFALQRKADLRPARALVLAAVATNLLVTFAPHNGAPPAGTPFVNGSTVVAACLAAVSFSSLRRGLWWIGALSLSYAALRSPGVGWPVAVLEASVTTVGSISVGLFAKRIATVFASVERAEASRTRAREAVMVAEQRERVRREWDRVVHDKVLGALTTASRSTTFDELVLARALAADALRALGVIETRTDRPTSLKTLAPRFGLSATGDDRLPDGLPDDVVDAVMAAAAEAFANVARHAATDTVDVRIAGGPDTVVVRIRDDGVGFDIDGAPARFGLGRSIPGHMADVGGTGIVASEAGHGTTVTLTWRQGAPDDGADATELTAHAADDWFSPLALLPPLWVVLNVALGWTSTRDLFTGGLLGWPPTAWIGAVAILVAVVLARGMAGWTAPAALAMSAAAVFAVAAVTPAGQVSDWRLWFSAATLALPLLFALSGREGAAWTYAILNPVAVSLGLAAHGASSVLSVPEVLLAPWIVTVPSVIALRALRRAGAELRAASEETLAIRRADHALALAASAARQRRDELSRDVIPVLTRLWRDDVFDADDRVAAAMAEAAARDRLVAGTLVDDQVARAVDRARARGARVDLRAAAGGNHHGLLRVFRTASTTLLSLSGAESRATIHWHPGDEAILGTVAISEPRARPDDQVLSRQLDGVTYVLEHDEGEVWFALFPPMGSASPEGGTSTSLQTSAERPDASVMSVHEMARKDAP